ncbi:hypothetical protein CBS101457_005806 [Exobasidium rhododendri]|nr:hypothetical protein CBS101457_005806 [Exobasidium rhododendri]
MKHTLEKTRQELESVEEAYEKGLLEVMRAHKVEEEIKREVSQMKVNNESLENKVKQFEKIGKKLVHAKMKEDAWMQERRELLQELEVNSQYEAEYKLLRSQAQLLLSKANLYENQMEELGNLNTVLASHTNPSQKIHYLDRLRRDLDEKRVECQVLMVERDEWQSNYREAQARLNLFVKVESRLEDRPRTAYKRVERLYSSTREFMEGRGVLEERSPNRSPGIEILEQRTYGDAGWRSGVSPGRAENIKGYGTVEGDLTLDDLLLRSG